jgi:peptide/nickel transport system substrate-binding protein
MQRSRLIPAMLLASTAIALPVTAAAQDRVLRIGMTAADIPRTLGQPDQGFEGNRFTGIPIYDALTHGDLSKEDAPSTLVPGFATGWSVDEDDTTKWTLTLRGGVTISRRLAVQR